MQSNSRHNEAGYLILDSKVDKVGVDQHPVRWAQLRVVSEKQSCRRLLPVQHRAVRTLSRGPLAPSRRDSRKRARLQLTRGGLAHLLVCQASWTACRAQQSRPAAQFPT